MAKDNKGDSDRSFPKRGAYPTPRDVLADAVPYKPDKSDKGNEPSKPDVAGNQPNSKTDSSPESP
jgi:hypothetical protein